MLFTAWAGHKTNTHTHTHNTHTHTYICASNHNHAPTSQSALMKTGRNGRAPARGLWRVTYAVARLADAINDTQLTPAPTNVYSCCNIVCCVVFNNGAKLRFGHGRVVSRSKGGWAGQVSHALVCLKGCPFYVIFYVKYAGTALSAAVQLWPQYDAGATGRCPTCGMRGVWDHIGWNSFHREGAHPPTVCLVLAT